MGAELSLNVEYKISISPIVYSVSLKKDSNNESLAVPNKTKHSLIEKYIKSPKFKNIIKTATHITTISDYVKDKLRFMVKKINYNKKEDLIEIIGCFQVDKTDKVEMQLKDVKESDVLEFVKETLHKESYSGEIILGTIPAGKVYLGLHSKNITIEKINK